MRHPIESPFLGSAPHTVVGACSLDCPDGCSWVVTLDQDGRPVGLRGNPGHPFTRGGLCAKVNPFLSYVARPDRLLHPLGRVGAKGEGRFERISWDEALQRMAAGLHRAVDQHGPESIWPYAGTGTVGWLQGVVGSGRRLFHSLGASRHGVNICSVTGHAGLSYTMGTAAGMDPEDLAFSGLILLWGTNTLTTNLHLWPFITRGRDAGAKLVVIDPVRTRTAARADRHLALRPGTDGALALGVAAGLVARGAADETYLSACTLGWEEFRDRVLREWSPARSADICGLDVGDVEWLVAHLAEHRPAGIRTLMGVQRHGGAGQAIRAMSCIPAITGDFSRRGGGLCYSTGPAYGLNEAALNRPDLQPNGPARRLDATRLAHHLLETDDPPVSALVMWAANPVVSNPAQRRVREGLSRDDLFTVVIDHVHTESTAYADVVLPSTTQLEHAELQDSYSHLYLNWNSPAVRPPGECLPHTEIFRRLATALECSESALYDSDDDLARAALSGEHPALAGVTLERLKERGWLRIGGSESYLPFVDGFPTPSGLFEFASEQAAQDGFGRFPNFRPPYEAESGDPPGDRWDGSAHSVVLLSAANHYLINSTFSTSDRHGRAGSATLSVYPDDAALFGVSDGDEARVANRRGEFSATVVVTDAVRPGVAATTKGLAPARPGGSTVNSTVAERDADMAGGATYHDNRVWVSPIG